MRPSPSKPIRFHSEQKCTDLEINLTIFGQRPKMPLSFKKSPTDGTIEYVMRGMVCIGTVNRDAHQATFQAAPIIRLFAQELRAIAEHMVK